MFYMIKIITKNTKQNPEYEEDTSLLMVLPTIIYSRAWDGSIAITVGFLYWSVQFNFLK